MKVLLSYNPKDILFLDIETSRSVERLEKGTPLYDAWAYKMRYQNELAEKSGIETLSLEESFAEKASLYAPFSKVVAIVIGKLVDNGKLKVRSFQGDEATLLSSFAAVLAATTTARPETAFCGFNNVGYDQPFLTKRMIVNGIRLPSLLDTGDKKPWEIRCIDLSALWRGTSFYPDSLLAVSTALGITSSKAGLTGSGVSDAFYAGKITEIVEYCTADVLCTANVFQKFLGQPLLSLEE